MMFSILCCSSEGNWLNLSKWALTTDCGRLNFRSSVRRASWYIVPQYVNSAMVVFDLPVTSVLKHVSLTSSVRDSVSMALLNWLNYPSHRRGSPLYWDSFHSGKWSFLDAANSCARSETVRLAGATGAAWPIVGINNRALIFNGLWWHEVVVIPVEYGAVWEDGLQKKTMHLLSTDTKGSLVGKIWVASEMYLLNGAVIRCGNTVVTVVICRKIEGKCNGMVCMGFEEPFSKST